MSAAEKAKALVDKYWPHSNGTVSKATLDEYDKECGNGEAVNKSLPAAMKFSKKHHAKACAIIACDEILSLAYYGNYLVGEIIGKK